jgi:hypothetical protein
MYFFSIVTNKRGSALIVALLILVVLTLIGISATTTTTFELQIAGNDKLFKRAFYAADGATEMSGEIIEQNIDNRNWNKVDIDGNLKTDGSGADINWCNPYYRGNVRIETANPYMNRDSNGKPSNPPDPLDCTTETRDFVYEYATKDASDSGPHTNIKAVGNTTLSTGSAVQLIAGYEGKGKGAAGGGAWITYDVRAYRQDVRNTEVKILLGWRHVL